MAIIASDPSVSIRVILGGDEEYTYTLGSVDPDASAENILLTVEALNTFQAHEPIDLLKHVKTSFYDNGL